MKSLNYLFTVSELRFFQYHVCTIKGFINKRVCDHVTYSTSNWFQPSHTCTQSHVANQRAFVYLRNTSGRWRRHWFKIQHGKSNASLYLSSLIILHRSPKSWVVQLSTNSRIVCSDFKRTYIYWRSHTKTSYELKVSHLFCHVY